MTHHIMIISLELHYPRMVKQLLARKVHVLTCIEKDDSQ